MSAGDRDWSRQIGRAGRDLKGPNPLVVLWRWRWELLLPAALLTGTVRSIHIFGWPWTAATSLSVVVGVLCRAELRRWIRSRFWCVVTQHRLRTGFAEAWIQSRRGRLPMILWTFATPHGERIMVWCRAGTTMEDLLAERAVLLKACWGVHEMTITPHHRYPHVVYVDADRRPVARPVWPDERDDAT